MAKELEDYKNELESLGFSFVQSWGSSSGGIIEYVKDNFKVRVCELSETLAALDTWIEVHYNFHGCEILFPQYKGLEYLKIAYNLTTRKTLCIK